MLDTFKAPIAEVVTCVAASLEPRDPSSSAAKYRLEAEVDTPEYNIYVQLSILFTGKAEAAENLVTVLEGVPIDMPSAIVSEQLD